MAGEKDDKHLHQETMAVLQDVENLCLKNIKLHVAASENCQSKDTPLASIRNEDSLQRSVAFNRLLPGVIQYRS